MILHALTSLTYVVVAVARRLGYIGDCVEPMESFGSFTPHRAGDAVFRHFNRHRWTGPVAPRVTRALILWLGLESHESVEDYLLPRFIDGNPISKYVTFAVLIVKLVWRPYIWYPYRL